MIRALMICFLSAVLLAPSAAQAQPIPTNLSTPRAGMSGLWINAEQPLHAVQLAFMDGAQVQVGWYTYDASGNPLWLIGLGSVEGAGVSTELVSIQGGRPPGQWEQSAPTVESWGTVNLEFANCNQLLMSWDSQDPAFASGSLELERYAGIQGQRCFAEELFSRQILFGFERRTQGFSAVFADLPEDTGEASYDLDFRREELPESLYGRYGLRLSGDNHSDDLAMLVKGPIEGLDPDSYYRVEIAADIASNVPTGCSGVGGSPGDSVYLKLGASTIEPLAAVDQEDGWLRLNIDYGQQSQEGANARVVGTLANSHHCDQGTVAPWELKTVSTYGQTMLIATDSDGKLWVFAGSDSAFEGFTQFYITALRVRLEPYEPEL